MKEIQFTKIESHPLKDCYMLFCPISWMPPFFGTLEQCKKKQPLWEKHFKDCFNNLSEKDKKEVMSKLLSK